MDEVNKKFDEIIEIIEKYQNSYKSQAIAKIEEARFWSETLITEEERIWQDKKMLDLEEE